MITLDQLYARTPVTTFTGAEIVAVQKDGVTGASVLSTLKNYIKNGFAANDVSDATTVGKQLMKISSVAAAKTLLEVPEPTPEPLAPVSITANTNLAQTHANRRVFVKAAATLTTNAAVIADTDTFTIYNLHTAAITLTPKSGETFRVKGSGSASTFSIPANTSVRVFLIDATTWFIEN
ncbi:hypothetical protein [Xanthomonas phage BUDD]|nr:hypothetical protein [Xanthomonas phage BUDD]